jgi:phosphoribosylformimino-5-aminoimidazole carboxamide ribotide isomerase
VRAALAAGVQRVILGTRACESIASVREMCGEFGGECIAVGIDAKEGRVAVRGWTETTKQAAKELALAVQDAGVGTIIYTDIATDGMLTGPNFAAMEELLEILEVRLIASGGVSSVADLSRLAALSGLYGAIIGKALYEGLITAPLPKFTPPQKNIDNSG